jgi:hypothetical protein
VRAAVNLQAKARRERYIAQGICCNCGNEPLVEGYVLGARCRAVARARYLKRPIVRVFASPASCPICGTTYHRKPNGYPRTCSQACGLKLNAQIQAAKRVRVEATCKSCGKQFLARPKSPQRRTREFCSQACWFTYKRQPLRERSCAKCGDTFSYQRHRENYGAKYCSVECYRTMGKGRRSSKDHNHNEIAEVFTKHGAVVIDTSAIGDGFPDMMVLYRGEISMIEVKNPKTQYGRKGLNQRQRAMVEEGWPVEVLRTIDEAMAFMARKRKASSVDQAIAWAKEPQ